MNNGEFYANGIVKKYTTKVYMGSVIDMLVDLDAGSIGFKIDGKFKGLAIDGNDRLKDEQSYFKQTVGFRENNDQVEILDCADKEQKCYTIDELH